MTKGADISEINGAVDFAALKAAGVTFVIIRCGYGNDIPRQDDTRFAENVRKADAAGMPWGVYLYSYAENTAMAKSEAQHVIRLLAGRVPAYGVWYDVEAPSQADADLIAVCEAFCTDIEAAGLYVGIYSMLAWMNTKLNSSRLDPWDKWVAQVYSRCEYAKPYGIWQYSQSEVIAGKEFDMDYAYKDYPTLTSGRTWTKEEIEELVRAAAESLNPVYNTLDEVPSYWRDDIRELVTQGIISGTGGKLGLTHSETKAAVLVRRALVKAAPKTPEK